MSIIIQSICVNPTVITTTNIVKEKIIHIPTHLPDLVLEHIQKLTVTVDIKSLIILLQEAKWIIIETIQIEIINLTKKIIIKPVNIRLLLIELIIICIIKVVIRKKEENMEWIFLIIYPEIKIEKESEIKKGIMKDIK